MREHVRALVAQGMTAKDSAAAVHLAWLIRVVDMYTFPESPAVVECRPAAHGHGFIAGYDEKSSNPERYLVYTRELHRKFRDNCLETRFLTGYGPGTPFPSLMERLTSVAVHEVRHRLQRLRGEGLRMWTPRTKATGLMAKVIGRVKEERMERILQAKIRSTRLLAGQLKEFDALVVEYAALHQLDSVEKPQDLVAFVLLEP